MQALSERKSRLMKLTDWCAIFEKSDERDFTIYAPDADWLPYPAGAPLPSDSADLVVGSPPYGTTMRFPSIYKTDKSVAELEEELQNHIVEFYRVLRAGRYCVMAVPVVTLIRDETVDWWHMVTSILRETGFEISVPPVIVDLGVRVYRHRESDPPKSLWFDIQADQLVFARKPSDGLNEPRVREITPEKFEAWRSNIWQVEPEHDPTTLSVNPTAWPRELPYRIIMLTSSPGDLVIDPWCGSARTAAAIMGGPDHADHPIAPRLFIGQDLQGQMAAGTWHLLERDWQQRQHPWLPL